MWAEVSADCIEEAEAEVSEEQYEYRTYGMAEYWDAKTGKPILPGTPEYEAIDRKVRAALEWSMRKVDERAV